MAAITKNDIDTIHAKAIALRECIHKRDVTAGGSQTITTAVGDKSVSFSQGEKDSCATDLSSGLDDLKAFVAALTV
jgi:hypothetical protein